MQAKLDFIIAVAYIQNLVPQICITLEFTKWKSCTFFRFSKNQAATKRHFNIRVNLLDVCWMTLNQFGSGCTLFMYMT